MPLSLSLKKLISVTLLFGLVFSELTLPVHLWNTYTSPNLQVSPNIAKAALPAPGGFDTNITMWYKADDGFNFVSGTDATWDDQSGNGHTLDAATVTGSPSAPDLIDLGINFNPTVEFNGADDALAHNFDAGEYPTGDFSTYMIMKAPFAGTSRGIWQYSDGGNNEQGVFLHNFSSESDYYVNAVALRANTTLDDNQVKLVSVVTDTANTESIFYENSKPTATNATVPSAAGDGCFGLGFDQDSTECGDGNNHYLGEIAEVVVYGQHTDDAAQNKIESYLALKYSASKDQSIVASNDGTGDYTSSDGTVVFDAHDGTSAKTHNQFIFGVAKDNDSSLDQQISKSSDENTILTISTDTDFTSANGTHTSLTDGQYLILGSDAGDLQLTSSEFDASTYTSRLDREWQASNTNNVTDINLHFEGLGSNNTRTSYLLEDTDGDFSTTGDQTEVGTLDSDGTIEDVDMNDQSYYTVATSYTTPGGITDHLTAWYEANDSYTFVSDTEATWHDLSNNLFHLTAEAVESDTDQAPGLNTTALNFNSALEFGDNGGTDDALAYDFADGGYPTGDKTVFQVVNIPENNGASDTGLWLYSDGGQNTEGIFTRTGIDGSNVYLNNSAFNTPVNYDDSITYLSTYETNTTTPQTSLSKNGSVDYTTATVTTTAGTGCLGVGYDQDAGPTCDDGQNHLDGFIGEMIIYDDVLDATETQKVESYLATKYGLTLDQSTVASNDGTGDYISSTGTVIFDAHDGSSQNDYNENIAIIGRDAGSPLDQQISTSASPTSILTISTDTNFTTANGTHTSLTDDQYLTVSSDDGNTDFTSVEFDSSTYTERIEREWKVNNVNNVGAVNLKFDSLDSSEFIAYYLLSDTDGDFTTTGDQTQVGALSSTGEINNVTLQDEEHYSVAKLDITPYPGGVENNLQIWLDANHGYTYTSNIDATWLGKSPNTLLFDSKIVGDSPDDAPELATEALNFNNAIQWTGDETDDALAHNFDGTTSSYPTGDRTIITVSSSDPTDSGDFIALWTYANPTSGNNDFNAESIFNINSTTQSALYLDNTEYLVDSNFDDNTTTIATYTVDTANTETKVFKNNLLGTTLNIATSVTDDGCLGLGYDQDFAQCNDGDNHLNDTSGRIGEFLVFDKELSPTEQQKVESYLAVKYGIELDQSLVASNDGVGDYISSEGTVIFDAHDGSAINTFNSDIFGIGRDQGSDLAQIKSASANPESVLTILAEGESSSDSNTKADRTFTDMDNDEFLIIANDNDSNTWTETNAPDGYQVLEKTWKAEETGEVGSIQIDLDVENANFDLPDLLGGSSYFLIIDTDNDESFSDETPTAMTDQGADTWRASNQDMDDNQFTFATQEPVIKGAAGVNDNIAYWYKADSSYTYTSATESTWADSSGNGFSLTADAVPGPSAPTIGTNQINFNPTLTFDGVDNALGIDYGPGEYPTGDVSTFMVMDAPPDESLNGIMWIYTDGGNEEQTVLLDNGQDNTFITFDNTFYATNINTDDDIPHIVSTVSDSAVNQGRFYKDGYNGFTAADSTNAGGAGCLTLGLDQGSSECNDGNFQYEGDIAELIFYADTITEPERAKIESYLAIKYGISLDQSNVASNDGSGDYVDSNGTVIFDAHDGTNLNTYNSDIFGIGRDDTSEHSQIKSKSQNPNGILTVLAEGESSSNDNDPDNLTLTDLGNQEFLMISNDDGLASWTETNSPAGFQILDKKWISDETGDVGSIQIDLDVENSNFDLPDLIQGSSYYIITDSDKDGSFTDETPTAMSDQGSNTWRASNMNMDENQFSFATEANPTIEFSSNSFSDDESDGANLPDVLVTGNLDSDTNVDIIILDTSTATLNSDFEIASQTAPLPKTITVVIPSGNYSQASFGLNSLNLSGGGTTSLQITSDIHIESDETIEFELSNPQGDLTLGDTGNGDSVTTSTTTYTILDDDDSTVSISATDATAIENSANTAEFTFTIDGASTNQTGSNIVVNYSIDPSSTATSGADFVALTGSVNIPNTGNSTTLTINTSLDDNDLEGDETLTLVIDSISNSGSSSLTPASSPNDEATITIQDDEVSDPEINSIIRNTPTAQTTNADTVTFRVTFSESVNNVDTTDFDYSTDDSTTANINSVNAISSTVYDVNLNSILGDGTLNLDIAPGNNIQGDTGTPLNGTINSEEEYIIDNTSPTLTLNQAAGQNDPTNVDSATFTVVFNEPINPATFIASDINIVGSTATVTSGPTEIAPNNDTTFQFTLTGMTSGDTASASIPSGRVTDLAGNTNLDSNSTDNSVTYTTDAPDILTIVRQTPTDAVTNANSVTFRVTFSEAVFNVTDDDFDTTTTGTVTNDAPTVSSISSSIYDLSISSVDGDGSLNLDIDPGNNIENIASNALSGIIGSEQEYTIDNTAPDANVTLTSPLLSNDADENIVGSCGIDAANGTVTITTDPANGFTTNYNTNISLDGSGDFTISNPDWSDGTYDLFFSCTDQADNGPTTSAAQGPVTIDTAFPTVTINQSSGQNDPTNNSAITFEAVFSLPINTATFVTTDLSSATSTSTGVTIDSISEIAPNDGTTFEIDTTGGTDGTIVLTLPENTVQTPAGNNNFASTSTDNSVTLDTIDPTPTAPSTPQTNLTYMDTPITGSCEAGASNGTVQITTSPANGFTSNYNSSISLDGDGDYNIPNPNWSEGTYDLIINCIDQATNNTIQTISNISIDTTAPAAPTITPITDNTVQGLTTTLTGSCEVASSVSISAAEIVGSPLSTTCDGSGQYSQAVTFQSETEDPVISINQTDAGSNQSATTTIQPDIDQDSDGIISSIENSAPNTGDNNDDGTLDSLQSNVTSLISPVTGNFQTLEVLNTCNNLISTEIVEESTLVVQDTNFSYPLGFTSSQINCPNPADSSDIRMIFDEVYDTTVWKFRTYNSSTNSYTDITDEVTYATFDNNGVNVTTASYTSEDGNLLTDQDVIENSQILIFSGPAIQAIQTVANTPSGSGSSSGIASFNQPFTNSNQTGSSNDQNLNACNLIDYNQSNKTVELSQYPELESEPQSEPIKYLLAKGIIQGRSNGQNLELDQLINRAEISKILSISREDSIEICQSTNSFSDIQKSDWFFNYIKNMQDKQIVSGYQDGQFKPNQNISYAEAYKMLAISFNLISQQDAQKISNDQNLEWHIPYRDALVNLTNIPLSFLSAESNQKVTRREIFIILAELLKTQN